MDDPDLTESLDQSSEGTPDRRSAGIGPSRWRALDARTPGIRSLGIRALGIRGLRAASAVLQRAPLPARADALIALPGRAGDHVLFSATLRELGAGRVPTDLQAKVARLLRRADRDLARGWGAAALEWFDQAIQLSFHPSVHHGSQLSPLATDPQTFLAPYRSSAMAHLMIDSPDVPSADIRGGHRVLVVSHGSWTFIQRVIAALTDEGAEDDGRAVPDSSASRPWSITTLDLSTLPADQRPSHRAALRGRWDLTAHGRRGAVPPALEAALADVDTVFVEWGTYAFAWLSQLDLGEVRLVARLHRFEAFTPYPMLADFARTQEMLFVSPAVRDQVAATSPRLVQAPSIRIVDNPHDYAPFTPTKLPGSERTLIQVGWAPPVKDAGFTLDVLERLREQDGAWRLLLVGPAPADPPLAREARYVTSVRERLRALGEAVEVLGRRDDVPDLMRRAGFVISSSRHEGTHEAVAEGAMAACVPVVRDWPEATRYSGAATIYPEDWVVADADAAAARILAHADAAEQERAGHEARAWTLSHRDPSQILAPYREALLGKG